MKKLCIVLVLMFLMLGASSVIAQTAQETPTSVKSAGRARVVAPPALVGSLVKATAVGSPTTSIAGAQRACVVNTESMRELDELVRALKEAEEADDEKLIDELNEKIRSIKEEIRKDTEKCESVAEPMIKTASKRVIAINIASSAGGVAGVVPVSEVVVPEPVAVSSGREVTEYYKLKISKIMAKDIDAKERIRELKELRNEIDKLIEELIKSHDEIKIEDVDELVTKIKVKPTKIEADDVIVSTTEKDIIAKVNDKELKIRPAKTHVIILDKALEVNAPEVSIENDTIKVGNSEVGLTPGDVIRKIKVEPKKIELREENDKAVYKIATEEKRKLFGFIPVNVRLDLTVDANEASIIRKEMPWWAALTS
ncbi:MAG: hypothetical protein J7J38_03045 [Candidatus Aenigmarchaeota archaeon]|nr:hypothetical protein [Candidatus Aenigmarchaeota archaeon]